MKTDLTVLIIEDDAHMRLGCVQVMQLAGIQVQGFGSAEEALRLVKPGFHGVIVTDMRLPGMDGMAVIKRCRQLDADLPVLVITGHGDITMAVDSMRSGAYDFITKPFAPELLLEVVQRALEKRALTLEISNLRERLARLEGVEGKLIGISPQMERVRRLVMEVADSPVDVLIRGETGAGKELVAQALHQLSRRKSAPYVALNCGGLPENLLDSELFGHEAGAFTGAQKRRIGKIEHANGGTLFLDEVESMPTSVQIKLLRVLQERVIERLGSNAQIPVDCRIVAASKDDLFERAQRQTFRADLYYRLNVVAIDLPPLRERREDIPMLLEHFMLLAASRYGRPQPAVSALQTSRLMAHSWPGNVRELRNVADCLVLGVMKEGLTDGGPTLPLPPRTLAETVDDFERSLIASELRRQGGNLTRVAEALSVAKTTLHDKVRRYGLLK
ncbi:two component, sigma54 specific, transcriptional regulator, Fis family [Leptothrix cholodnii SP-6]|uniref:Two component, sigma54 specific, transcriptional regulator, Fis family n=1 Tax=Leptothrix cholodnii (strain ATCC 51168 / LMG 8142 / SP-6) TaxID=395495 RepID=B1Y876_LEPCP|nr:sigma-54 dependent transcriptional regulator [Leptothrix cholodnii]ACB34946.1 two component, sigma54 specific, transcriptional regulator, Fis family [Leptothrix cholodnii SP-6]